MIKQFPLDESPVPTRRRENGQTASARPLQWMVRMIQPKGPQRWEGELFRLLVENVKDYAIFVVGTDGKVLSWSKGAERLCGWKEEEILGKDAGILFTPEDRRSSEPEKEMGKALEHGRGEDDRWHIRKDGSRFWCSGVMTPLRDEAGLVHGFAKIMRDLTERYRQQEKQRKSEALLRQQHAALQQANQSKDRFLAVLSHELRNPLAPLRNTVQLLQQQTPESSELQQVYNILDRQVRLLTRLVDDLLDLSRITSGKLGINKELIEVSVVLERAVEMARPAIDAHRHNLSVEPLNEPIWLQGDSIRLEQAVINLLTNAAKYTEEGGKIWLSAERQDTNVAIRVRDTGVGLEAEMLPRIFEMFTQVDSSTNRAQGGLGIGLSVVKRIAELHGGSVDARSGGPGTGSEFTLRLPAVLAAIGEKDASYEAAKKAASALRILVVDDNADSADSLALLLKHMGHDVQAVHSGAAAIHVVKHFQPQVILLDLSMPILDGYQVAQRLRLHLDMKQVVLIALTGYGQENERQRTLDAGFAYHLVKPIDPQQLQELLAVLTEDEKRSAS